MHIVKNAALACATVENDNLLKRYLALGWQVLEIINADKILKINTNVPWKKKMLQCVKCLGVF